MNCPMCGQATRLSQTASGSQIVHAADLTPQCEAIEYVLAKFVPVHHGGLSLDKRPSHIVRNGKTTYGGFRHPALCGTSCWRRWSGELTDATCRKCLREAIRQGIIQAPAELGDPVHHGDIFSRIEASQ